MQLKTVAYLLNRQCRDRLFIQVYRLTKKHPKTFNASTTFGYNYLKKKSTMVEKDPRKAKIGVDILPFEMGYLPEIYQKKAEVELYETPDRRAQCIRQLREMLKEKESLKYIDFEEDYLLQNLRARKFNVERASTNVKNLLNFTKKHPHIFTDLKFEVTVRTITDKIATLLPWRCQDGCAIFLVKLDNWKPDLFPVAEVERMSMLLILQSLRDPMTQVNGFKAIIDVETASMRYLRYCTPQNLYSLYHGTQDCAPARYKGIHFVNESAVLNAAWIVVRPFLSDKLKQRIHFHSSKETLLDFFPSAVLPTSYGGELQDYDQTKWLKKVMEPERLALFGGGCLKHLKKIQ